ncbi:ATP-binding cassette domain-containing protein, partial [Lactococcus lactis]|uniref:ATP-binding cassette domain-containing protein n=1 Tax=Lactococcus lactis TaxID=1358 RepID=UPI0022E6C5F4
MSLNIENLYKTYGKKNVLNDISVNFQTEKIYGLLGNNGAGKSTLLNIINNRIFYTKGKITLDGRLVTENEKSLNNIHLMSENNLYPSKLKIKSLFHLIENFYGDFDWNLANKMLSDFDLEPTKRMSKLSTGYRSIAKLIIALCVPCEYIFLDEPVLGLKGKIIEDDSVENILEKAYIVTGSIEEVETFIDQLQILEKTTLGGSLTAFV